MRREYVESSVIKSIGYNEGEKLLEVEIWDSGKIYQYIAVPVEEYFDFMDAKSLGEYYNKIIKKKYEYREVAT